MPCSVNLGFISSILSSINPKMCRAFGAAVAPILQLSLARRTLEDRVEYGERWLSSHLFLLIRQIKHTTTQLNTRIRTPRITMIIISGTRKTSSSSRLAVFPSFTGNYKISQFVIVFMWRYKHLWHTCMIVCASACICYGTVQTWLHVILPSYIIPTLCLPAFVVAY